MYADGDLLSVEGSLLVVEHFFSTLLFREISLPMSANQNQMSTDRFAEKFANGISK